VTKKYHLLYKGSQILVLALTNALNSENINPIIKDQGESARRQVSALPLHYYKKYISTRMKLKKGK